MKQERPFVLIVGAGIGGVSAALALARAGLPVRVLEAAPRLQEVGAGIQLGPNATRVLDDLGVFDALRTVAVHPRELIYMDALSGERITSLDLGHAFRERYGHPYIVVHRHDLHQRLLDACLAHGVNISPGKRIVDIEDHLRRARVTCEDGSQYEADVLVGADGLHSQVRALIDDTPPRRHPYMAYRGTLPTREHHLHGSEDAMVMWVGPGLHMVQYKVRAGDLYNQVGVFKSPSFTRDSEDWGRPEEMETAFSACCEIVARDSRMLSRERRWPMIDRDPIASWTRNRITLLGDAAHPMQPFLAQGGCQALEDADILARCLTEHADPVEALLEYERRRIPRSARVVLNSRRMGEASHIDGIGVELRNAVFGRHETDDFTPFDWLYSSEIAPAADRPWLEPREVAAPAAEPSAASSQPQTIPTTGALHA